MKKFITRAYNSFTFNYSNSTIKKFSKEERLVQETEYYKHLPKNLSIFYPRLVSSGFLKDTKQYFLELELYPYENLGKLLVEGKLTPKQWKGIASQIQEILLEFHKTTLPGFFVKDMRAMYIEKTEAEYKKLAEGFKTFKKLTAQKTVIINGVEYLNFDSIWPKIKKKFGKKLLNSKLSPSIIHGDFCFSNILVGFLADNKTILRFVDPRGKFGKFSVYGDPYYDLAKLMHSTDVGYEYIIYDQFKITQKNNNEFILKYFNFNKMVVNRIFNDQLYSKYDVARIKLIQATIYVGMCARHYDSEKRQLAMYLSGIKLLNELLWN